MKLAFFGDVVGRPGRQAVREHLPSVRQSLGLDFAVVNAENAAGGFGLTESIANEFFDAGADCLTLGDHAWDQREALTYIEREPRLLRPLNYPEAASAPGKGAHLFVLPDGRRVGVIQAQGIVIMQQLLENTFGAVDSLRSSLDCGMSPRSAKALCVVCLSKLTMQVGWPSAASRSASVGDCLNCCQPFEFSGELR